MEKAREFQKNIFFCFTDYTKAFDCTIVQLLSHVGFFVTTWTHGEFAQIHTHWVNDAIQPSHPLSPFLLPSIFPSIRVSSNELALHIRWPKYWSFSFSTSSSNEYSGLISFTVCFITNCGKFLKRWEYQTTLPVSWKSCMQVRKQQLEQDIEQLTGSKLGK